MVNWIELGGRTGLVQVGEAEIEMEGTCSRLR